MDRSAPWTIIERARTDGIAWRCTLVRQLNENEFDGKNRVIVSAKVDNLEVTDGSVNIVWGCDGLMQPQVVPARGPQKLDYNSIIIQPGYAAWVKLTDTSGFPSDKVTNLHCKGSLMGKDKPVGYHVTFQLQRGEYVDPPIDVPELTLESLDARLRLLETYIMSNKVLRH